jgi:glycosyltransferase involved in cell wall biosynthesis
MKIVATSYVNTSAFTRPEAWLDRISFYTGILEQLAKQHEVNSIEQINYNGKLKRNGVVYHFLNFKKPKLYFPFGLHRYIKRLGPDVMLVNGLIFPLQVIQLRWMLGKKIKIIMLHRAEKPSHGKMKMLQQMADRHIQAYLFASHEMGREWITRGIIASEKKIFEVMEASSSFHVMDRKEAVAVTKLQGSPVYLWVGRLDANKDPVTVVKAFKEFLHYQPSACLYMIHQTDELLGEVKKLSGEAKNIHLAGRVEHEDLRYWYNSSDFIISGSHYEGSGIAVCEAMSCGCVPVITNIPSFRMMTGRGRCGLLYEPGNEKELLEALLKTREMDMEKEKQKVTEQFKEELSFESIAGKIQNVIASL